MGITWCGGATGGFNAAGPSCELGQTVADPATIMAIAASLKRSNCRMVLRNSDHDRIRNEYAWFDEGCKWLRRRLVTISDHPEPDCRLPATWPKDAYRRRQTVLCFAFIQWARRACYMKGMTNADVVPEGQRAGPAGTVAEVLLAFLKLGLIAFGGPVAHLGYFRAEFVERRRWLSEQAYAELVGLCQFLPGPASSQTGFALGLLRAGPWGGLAAWAGFTLPSAALLVAFAAWATRLSASPVGAGCCMG